LFDRVNLRRPTVADGAADVAASGARATRMLCRRNLDLKEK
jgi:hypothetical protein